MTEPPKQSERQLIMKPYVTPRSKRNTKSSKPQKKRGPRLRKPAQRPAASGSQVGLASSQHATGNKPREVHTLSKGLKRRGTQGNDMDLQSEITLR